MPGLRRVSGTFLLRCDNLVRMRLALTLVALGLGAQTRETNPYTLADQDALAKGRRLYSFYCVFCHGMDGASGRGSQLASSYRKHGSSDREVYRTIADGVPGTEMTGHPLEEDEVWKILLFVRRIEQNASGRGQGCRTGASGDPVKGAAVFQSVCQNCHSAASRLGPDLAAIGATRSREHLRESIVEPDKVVSRAFRAVRVRTTQGEAVHGLLLNQDEYTIHLLDMREQVRSFQRSGLAAVEFPKESLMPSFAKSLSAGQIDDVLAHLCRGKR